MKLFWISFKYDNGYDITAKDVIAVARNETEAGKIFEEKIYKIFSRNDDVCSIISITELSENTELIYMQNGNVWIK